MQTYLFTTGKPLLGIGLTITIVGVIFKHMGLVALGIGFISFTSFFLRVPNYTVDQQDNRIVSPSYGTIKRIWKKDDILGISIFLSPMDPHFQVSPVNGSITAVKYKEGEFHPAFMMKKSRYNEQAEWKIATHTLHGNHVIVRQIAGLLANRIRRFKVVGDLVEKGEHLGLIMFGSRVDIEMKIKSNNIRIMKNEGEYIKAGEPLFEIN